MSPVAICSTRELTESGAFWTLDVAGTPVLVVRDAHGTIRAFENVCRHRGVRPHPRSPLDVAALLGPVDAELTARGVESFGVRERVTAALTSELVTAVRPRLVDEDVLHLVSDDLAVVLHAEDVSIFVRARQRAETGFGEASTAASETCSIEHLRLGPTV